MIIGVGQASAATYPGGGSTFTGSAEGWTGNASCKVLALIELPILCTATQGYDATAGNPAGSFAAKTTIPANLIGLFQSEVTAESPNFVAEASGEGSVSLERQFVPGNLVALNPKVEYTVTLVDKSSGMKQQAVAETIEAASVFLPKSSGVSLVAGHTYAVQIVAKTGSTIVAIGLLGGESIARFDNVSVSGPSATGGNPVGGGGNGGNGSGGDGSSGTSTITSSQLQSLIESHGFSGPATLKGNRLSVKVKCPTKAGAACNIAVQGQLKKGKAATNRRRAKIQLGKTKKLALKVKPAAKSKVMAKKRLLFKMTVKAGSAKATVYKSLKLIKK